MCWKFAILVLEVWWASRELELYRVVLGYFKNERQWYIVE
jgi:hypothetical protein